MRHLAFSILTRRTALVRGLAVFLLGVTAAGTAMAGVAGPIPAPERGAEHFGHFWVMPEALRRSGECCTPLFPQPEAQKLAPEQAAPEAAPKVPEPAPKAFETPQAARTTPLLEYKKKPAGLLDYKPSKPVSLEARDLNLSPSEPVGFDKFLIRDTNTAQPITWKNLNDSLVTNKSEAFFWSGRTNGVGGEKNALRIAQSYGGTTLEGLLKSKGIEMPGQDHPMSKVAWEEVSSIYAKNVSGTVRVVLGQEVREGSVWSRIEFEMLKTNPKVKEIIAIDPETLTERRLFSR